MHPTLTFLTEHRIIKRCDASPTFSPARMAGHSSSRRLTPEDSSIRCYLVRRIRSCGGQDPGRWREHVRWRDSISEREGAMFVYVGAYIEPPSGSAAGIAVFRFDAATGPLHSVQTVPGVESTTAPVHEGRHRF